MSDHAAKRRRRASISQRRTFEPVRPLRKRGTTHRTSISHVANSFHLWKKYRLLGWCPTTKLIESSSSSSWRLPSMSRDASRRSIDFVETSESVLQLFPFASSGISTWRHRTWTRRGRCERIDGSFIRNVGHVPWLQEIYLYDWGISLTYGNKLVINLLTLKRND